MPAETGAVRLTLINALPMVSVFEVQVIARLTQVRSLLSLAIPCLLPSLPSSLFFSSLLPSLLFFLSSILPSLIFFSLLSYPPVGTGCPTSTPVKCFTGECVSTKTECPSANLCPAATPLRCADGVCVAANSECSADTGCVSGTIRCPGGSCEVDFADCKALNNCPIFEPKRCADGACVAGDSGCSSTTVCPADIPHLCHDGSCVGSTTLCPASTACGESLTTCDDGTCATRCNHSHYISYPFPSLSL